ncbi:hypothetical protein BTS2_1937 [Bacillus sp. TS-2]|nr:hypothetical protein BTS2_1937 [Bacillus sp. TS-2]
MTLKGVISYAFLQNSLEAGFWSKESRLFTGKERRTQERGQKGAIYSPKKAPNPGKRSKGSHLFTQKER